MGREKVGVLLAWGLSLSLFVGGRFDPLGVPVEATVGLSAASPRSFVAAGFPLLSLTRTCDTPLSAPWIGPCYFRPVLNYSPYLPVLQVLTELSSFPLLHV